MGAIGPTPFAGMMLADHGADVIRIDRPGGANRGIMPDDSLDLPSRGRRSLVLDLRVADGAEVARKLADTADVFIEGFRPGVMERLGLGPDMLLRRNPKLVYGRMTGWGQTGPLAQSAGHDINYIALSGNLHGYGRLGDRPVPPVNAVADYGGGGMLLAFGTLAAVLSARVTGVGQVVDCAMVDGAALLTTMIWAFRAQGLWQDERGVNLIDTGAPFYDTYETADGKFVSLGAIEPAFYERFRRLVGLDTDPTFDRQMDRGTWPAQARTLTNLFRGKSRAEWCAILEGSDACFAPILSMSEAPGHPQNTARRTFVAPFGITQPAPAPRFSRTPAKEPALPRPLGADCTQILAEIGFTVEDVKALERAGAFGK